MNMIAVFSKGDNYIDLNYFRSFEFQKSKLNKLNFPRKSKLTDLHFSKYSNYLFACFHNGNMIIWNVNNGKMLSIIGNNQSLKAKKIKLSKSGNHIFILFNNAKLGIINIKNLNFYDCYINYIKYNNKIMKTNIIDKITRRTKDNLDIIEKNSNINISLNPNTTIDILEKNKLNIEIENKTKNNIDNAFLLYKLDNILVGSHFISNLEINKKLPIELTIKLPSLNFEKNSELKFE